jgi:hypothetical protein
MSGRYALDDAIDRRAYSPEDSPFFLPTSGCAVDGFRLRCLSQKIQLFLSFYFKRRVREPLTIEPQVVRDSCLQSVFNILVAAEAAETTALRWHRIHPLRLFEAFKAVPDRELIKSFW